MRIVASERASEYIRRHGRQVWVWLDPHRGAVGSYVYLEAHTEPAGSSRTTRFSRSSRRPHRFGRTEGPGFVVHHDWGRMDPPDELHFELRGWRNKRLEAYWNGCVFVDDAPQVGFPSS